MGVNYTGKFVLAPMVRAGELPTRLVALKSGADLVWGPEIIDRKILTFKRIENDELGTIDFVSLKEGQQNNNNLKANKYKKPPISFRTHRELENGKLIFQMGTANADLAVKAAKIIIDDVDGLDINAGCPKHFSVHSGMGAALLKTPDLLCEILTRLVKEVGAPKMKPVSVKIRLLEDKDSTLNLISRLVKTGISNLTLHCRKREMRNRESPIRDYLRDIIPICRENNVSFIVNGGIKTYADYKKIQTEYGDDIGSMVAEAAESNPTIFQCEKLHWSVAAIQLNNFARTFDNNVSNTKYCLLRIVPGKSPIYLLVSRCKTQEELDGIFSNLNKEGELISKEDEKDSFIKNKRELRILDEEANADAKEILASNDTNIQEGDNLSFKRVKT